MTKHLIAALAYLIAAPILGGLLSGIDRITTARMQSRKGPPLLQPFYDVLKLIRKKSIVSNYYQIFYAACFLVFIMLTGALFFSGGDLLLVIFALTVASVFFILGAYSAHSPYSNLGAERELVQMMAYEPMVILTAIGMYAVTKSFHVSAIAAFPKPLIVYLPGIFLGFLYILTIKLRKSPFDLSTSHHGHQELVKGITTDFSGKSLAMIEISHWYENIMLMGFVYLFFGFNPALAILAVLAAYLLEILIDNTYARLTWRFTLKSSWVVALVLGVINFLVINFIVR